MANKGGFPDAVIAKLDTETRPYAFPPKAEGDNSVLVAGDIAAAFNNDANTLKLRNFIASKENGTEQAKAARFDGSDSMPAKVGAGTFWTEPVKWLSGQQDLDTTLNNIDASFPKASS